MSYNINFTESTNPLKPTITVQDNSVDDTLNIVFPGRNFTNYGTIIGENFLHLLENFAAPNPPSTTITGTPVEGQLWFDNTLGTKQLKVYSEGKWISAGGLRKSSAEPLPQDSVTGELWVNTTTQQLYLYTGAAWRLVGPDQSTSSNTGVSPEIIIDSNDTPRNVVSQYIENVRVAITSSTLTPFQPKVEIPGFTTIKPGINLHSDYNNYYGVSEKSSALLVGTTTVSSANFLRKDSASTTDYLFSVKNNSGLNVGFDNQISLSIDGNARAVLNQEAGGNITLQISDQDILTLKKQVTQGYVGINNISPSEALDITGNLKFSGSLNSTLTTGNSIFAGNLEIQKTLRVKADALFDQKITVSSLLITSPAGITPDQTTTYDIGSPTLRFKDIYAKSMNVETITGTFYGTAGSAAQLNSPTTFTITGDIESSGFSFNGYPGNETKSFVSTLGNNSVWNKPAITTLKPDDEFLVSSIIGGPGGTIQLRKITKSNMWAEISQVKAGMIVPFASSVIPPGWLLCDGTAYSKSTYSTLYSIIGDIHGSTIDNFNVPNMQGRAIVGAASGEVGNTGNFTEGGAGNIPWIKLNYIIYTGKDS